MGLDYSPSILKNKGIPVHLFKLDDSDEYVRTGDDDDEDSIARERVWIKFNANHIAAIEDEYDGVKKVTEVAIVDSMGNPTGEQRTLTSTCSGMEGFQVLMERKPTVTIRKTMAMVLDRDEQAIGKAMIPTEMGLYSAAIGAAWAQSNGMTPENLGKMMEVAVKAAKETVERAAVEMEKGVAEMAKLGGETTSSSDTSDSEPAPTTPEPSGPGPNGADSGPESPKSEDLAEASSSSGS